jgi:NAD(P)-dependent dehydrogenase (short-subunit alcohol dehydrogenase family)
VINLSDKVALVTGGGSGIGAATTRLLAGAGARVAVVDLDEAGAKAVADEVGGIAIAGDVSAPDAMNAIVAQVEEQLGRLDVVHLNAGIVAGQSGIEDFDLVKYRQIVGVNLDHVVFGTVAAVPALRRAGGGHIVATSSLAGLMPIPGNTLYTLTKHAVVGYVRSAAPPLAEEGIRVNAVCPGFADTPLIAAAKDRFAGFPLLSADDVASAVGAILERGQPGECWYVQPGREPGPYGFRGVPGPGNHQAPPSDAGADI